MSYDTGGLVSGKSASLLPGEDAADCNVEEASIGNSDGPNTAKASEAAPGGYGSTGTASSSSPSGMK